jgi:cbb3-type cytochrome oxidase subunit 3
MIPMDRETLMMVATIVAIAGVIFLFREMNKAKQDVDNLKNFSAQLIQKLSTPMPMPSPAPQVDTTEEEEVTEEKKEE